MKTESLIWVDHSSFISSLYGNYGFSLSTKCKIKA